MMLGVATTASSHQSSGISGRFSSGFMDPVLRWYHVFAMVAVGITGAILGYPAILVLPVVFPLVMAASRAQSVAAVLERAGGIAIAGAGAVFLARVV